MLSLLLIRKCYVILKESFLHLGKLLGFKKDSMRYDGLVCYAKSLLVFSMFDQNKHEEGKCQVDLSRISGKRWFKTWRKQFSNIAANWLAAFSPLVD